MARSLQVYTATHSVCIRLCADFEARRQWSSNLRCEQRSSTWPFMRRRPRTRPWSTRPSSPSPATSRSASARAPAPRRRASNPRAPSRSPPHPVLALALRLLFCAPRPCPSLSRIIFLLAPSGSRLRALFLSFRVHIAVSPTHDGGAQDAAGAACGGAGGVTKRRGVCRWAAGTTPRRRRAAAASARARAMCANTWGGWGGAKRGREAGGVGRPARRGCSLAPGCSTARRAQRGCSVEAAMVRRPGAVAAPSGPCCAS